MLRKIIRLLFCFIIIFMILFNFHYVKSYQIIVKETTYLWFSILLPSIMPMYVLSNFLISVPTFFNFFYKILNPIYHFESSISTSIFILSFFTGNPSITLMINDNINNDLLSISEGNRLMRCTSHFSFIFIKIITGKYFLLVFLSLFFSSSLIYIFSSKNNNKIINKVNYSFFDTFNKIIDNGYKVLLKILYIMLIVSFIKCFMIKFLPFKNINFITIFFEVTTGCNYINLNITNIFLRLILIVILLSSNGLSLIVQTINSMSNNLEIKNYILFRLFHIFLSSFIFFIFWIIK